MLVAKAKTFQTHTGLLIYRSADGTTVGIVGTQDKELLVTPDKRASLKYFNGLVKHYKERAEAEA